GRRSIRNIDSLMLSLLNAGLLPWIAAISIPVLIHLLTRKTRRRMDLPTVRFLQKTLAQQSSLFRWRHLLLLLLRTLAVGAVALMSEPVPDLTAVQNAVREAQPSEERGDPAAAVNLAVEQLGKSNARVRRLYLLSDFQRTNWADVKFDTIPADTKVLFVNTDP